MQLYTPSSDKRALPEKHQVDADFVRLTAPWREVGSAFPLLTKEGIKGEVMDFTLLGILLFRVLFLCESALEDPVTDGLKVRPPCFAFRLPQFPLT